MDYLETRRRETMVTRETTEREEERRKERRIETRSRPAITGFSPEPHPRTTGKKPGKEQHDGQALCLESSPVGLQFPAGRSRIGFSTAASCREDGLPGCESWVGNLLQGKDQSQKPDVTAGWTVVRRRHVGRTSLAGSGCNRARCDSPDAECLVY